MRDRLTYANVVATIALFIALGGASYAAVKLPKNSVGTKQLKKDAVTGAKVKQRSLTGQDLDVSTLGTVPRADEAARATTAGIAGSAASAGNAEHLQGKQSSDFAPAKAEPWHEVPKPYAAVTASAVGCDYGPPSCCPVTQCRWVGATIGYEKNSLAYYRDPYGVVRVKGFLCINNKDLEEYLGYDCINESVGSDVPIFSLPPGYRPGHDLRMLIANGQWGVAMVFIEAQNGKVSADGHVPWNPYEVELEGLSFRCEPSGVDGCP